MVKPNSENSAHRGVRFAESPTPSHIATPTTAAPVASAVAPSTLASAAVDAARAQYLDKHHVYAMIDAALQSLLATRPEDPYAALAACFAKQSESNALTSTGAAATS
ncbi:Hypothetical protein, putative [Bodo saltans]|uniref:Uncharacterized protein n=1 Tax=Bodo saltans TaxID=75058 RepID=A0A0S4IL57_BODSA|nr:Hypothetical protein, putative [Bodo saltans]|eukprot:CUE69161.1 Hypothetical protein, putative [Bodo saltans]